MRKNFFYYLSPSIITGVIGFFIAVPVTTYYLDPQDFGVIGYITAFSILMFPLASTGFSWVLSTTYFTIREEERKELIFNLFVAGLILRAFWMIVFGVAGALVLPRVMHGYQPAYLGYYWCFLLGEWFNYGWEMTAYLIMLQKKAKVHAALDLVKFAARVGVLLICLICFKFKAVSLALAYLATGISGFLFSAAYLRRYMRGPLRKRWLIEIVRLGAPTIPLSFCELATDSINRFCIERWSGMTSLGLYNHSTDYKKAFLMPHRAFQKTYAPEVLTAVTNKNPKEIARTRQALRGWLGLLTAAGVVLFAFSRETIALLTHDKFTGAAPLVCLWFLLLPIYAVTVGYTQFLLCSRYNRFVFVTELATGILFWMLIPLAAAKGGITGATAAMILYYFALYLPRYWYARKKGAPTFEGSYFIATIVFLLPVLYIITTRDVPVMIKCTGLFVLLPLIHKVYKLPDPRGVIRQFRYRKT